MSSKTYNFNFSKYTNKKIYKPSGLVELKKHIKQKFTLIGNRRSYNDSIFGDGKHISMLKFNKIIHLDLKKKIIEVQAGVLIFEMINYCINNGFFLNCVPGCKYVSIGGMIANNISGKLTKNNRIKYYVQSLKIINNKGNVVECSKKKNKNLFNLTIGGKGRTGPIISAKIKLARLCSDKIYTTKIFFKSFSTFYKILKKKKNFKYCVVWLDFTSKKFNGIFFFGKHKFSKSNNITFKYNDLNLPSFGLRAISYIVKSKTFTKIFNTIFKFKNLFFHKKYLELNDFFFPQNKIRNWNDCFKKEGFLQFQFNINKNKLEKIINNIKQELSQRNLFSNFVIIKFYNNNILSISLDFPVFKNEIKIKKFINYFTLKHNLDVELSKDISLFKLNKKTSSNNPVFNDKYSKFFFKNYKSNLFKRLIYKKN